MTIGSLYNANNVVVGQAAVFTAPAGTPMPTISASYNASDPFNTTFWPSPWVAVGATEQGWKVGATKNTQSIQIEEQSTPVGTTITTQSVTIEGSLSEDITATLVLALNATSVTTAPTTTVVGYDTVTLSSDPLYYAVALVTTNYTTWTVPTTGSGSKGRIYYAPKWTSLDNVTTSFRRAAAQRMYPVKFQTVCAENQIQIINVTKPPTT
jgi:hypothetical protein